jgi:hypothetical protein
MQVVQNDSSFIRRAIAARGIFYGGHGLDYFAAPIFGSPIIGDILDSFVISILYSITRSKLATL